MRKTRKIDYMDAVLDALAGLGAAGELVDMRPIAEVAPVQLSRNAALLDTMAKFFAIFVQLMAMLPMIDRRREVIRKFTEAMGTYLEIMEGADDEGMGNENSRA